MGIESKSSSGSMKIMPTCKDDFYLLSSILVPGDNIESFTTRKLSMDSGKTQQKISLLLAIKIETVDTDLEDGIMYVKGRTCKEYEHIKQSSYHTLNLVLNEEFSIYKESWSDYDIRKIKEAKKESPEMCFVIFYEKDCVVSTLSSNGVTNIYKEEVKNKNFKAIINSMLGLKNIKTFVISSISDIRNEFFKSLVKEHKSIEKRCSVIKLGAEYKNIPNSKVVNKIITDKEFSKSFADIAYIDDLREIEAFFLDMELGKKDFCIGVDEIKEAYEYGAIKTLFITDQFCKPRSVEERKANDAIINQVKKLRAKICTIPVSNEFGERLKKMGSIAGKLQFEYK